jgi:hypothetical protein
MNSCEAGVQGNGLSGLNLNDYLQNTATTQYTLFDELLRFPADCRQTSNYFLFKHDRNVKIGFNYVLVSSNCQKGCII